MFGINHICMYNYILHSKVQCHIFEKLADNREMVFDRSNDKYLTVFLTLFSLLDKQWITYFLVC